MSKEDVMVSVGIDLDSLKKSLATVQAEMAKAFGDSGKAAGAFGVVINNVTKTTNASTNATKEKIDALKLEAQAHKTAGDAAKAEAAANVAASKSMEAAAKAQGAADVAVHRASAEAVRAQGTAYKEAFGAQQAQSNAAAAAARAQTAQINAQTAALRNFSAVARSSGGPVTRVNPAFISGGAAAANMRNYQVGNAAMQVQDIAVSLQSGMSGLQVMGQQGSQLLSILGPKGMLLGGVIAVGAALGTGIYGGQKAFKALNEEAQQTNIELENIARHGSGAELFSGIGRAEEQFKSIKKSIEDANGLFATGFANLSRFSGGDTAFERTVKLNEQLTMTELNRRDISRAIVADMERENEILQMIADGDKEGAEYAKRKLETDREIAKINASQMTESEKSLAVQAAEENLRVRNQIANNEAIAERKRAIDKHNESEENRVKKQKQEAHDFDKMVWEMQDEAQREYYEEVIKQEEKLKKYKLDRAKRESEEYRDFIAAVNKSEDKRIEKEKKRQEDNEQDAITQRDKVSTLAMEIQKGQNAASILAEKLRIEKEITKAKQDGNKELVAGLEKERELLNLKNAIDEQLKTPEQKKSERAERRAREKAAREVASRERRRAQAARAIGFGGFVDENGNAKAVPNLQPNAPAAGAAGGGAGNAMKVDTLVVKVLKHG